jgi:hypothetical protein
VSESQQNSFTIQDLVSLCMFESENDDMNTVSETVLDANHYCVQDASLMEHNETFVSASVCS